MSRRFLRVWVDAEAETCGGCWHRWSYGAGPMRCRAFRDSEHNGTALVAAPGKSAWEDTVRCDECIAAESKALTVAGSCERGLAPPDRDSSGGYEV